MKINRILIGALFVMFAGCANLKGLNVKGNEKEKEELQKKTQEEKIELLQEEIYIGNHGVEVVLKEIRENWKKNIQREVVLNKLKRNYEVYVGETLKINSNNISDVIYLNQNKEKDSKIEFYAKEESYYFRSIYQGNYKLEVNYLDGTIQIINIFNKMKFKFSENESYRIINDEYSNEKYEQALKNLDLHKLAFSDSGLSKEIRILNTKVLFETKNYEEAIKAIEELKIAEDLTEENLMEISEIENKLNLASGKIKTEESHFFDLGKNAYEKSRYNEAILYLNNVSKENLNPDKYYYISDSYFRVGNYEKAIENYELYLNLGAEGIKKAEVFYNIGLAYEKLGEIEKATKSFRTTIERFPGTSWARKSNIYLIRLKSN
ncbi:MAG: tetratricopeptide repeat protein [Fusobacteriaceae bacterium]